MTNGVSQVAVMTTINSPNEAMAKLLEFGETANAPVIVVGDTKTPESWQETSADFLNIEKQSLLFEGLSEALPKGHYSRKNLGYLRARFYEAEWIYETDDDNFPVKSPFSQRDLKFEADVYSSNSRWVNVYEVFGYTPVGESPGIIWPRGFDLMSIREPSFLTSKDYVESPIQQGLADGDPDVDAIYRLVLGGFIEFKSREPITLGQGKVCPTNSQTTWWHKSVAQLMYLPSTCTFRLTDILRGFVAWRILLERQENITFFQPVVRQDRNQHDLIKDFKDEVGLYLLSETLIQDLLELNLKDLTPSEQLVSCYKALELRDVISSKELEILKAWNQFFT